MADRDVKSNIMRAAISLVEHGDGRINEVTVRDIAAAAGVGVGLINYHFGSKDELLRLCAQAIVSEELARFRVLAGKLVGCTPLERLRLLARRTCDYMADRPNLSRLSLLTDMNRGDFAGDNTDQTMAAFLPMVAAACGKSEDDLDCKLRTHMLVHSFQAAFLRSASVRERLELDFYAKEDRDRFVDLIIDRLF